MNALTPRISNIRSETISTPDVNARFLDSTGSDAFPATVASMNQVSSANPRFTGGDVAMYVAVEGGAVYELNNITKSTSIHLDNSEATVEIDRVGGRPYVFAIKPSTSGNLILVGREREIDTGYSYTTLFGASEDGHLAVVNETSRFLNYEDFEPISSTVLGLENHASLPQFGLFTTSYTRETDLNIGVTIKPTGLNVSDLPTSATGLLSGDVWFDGSSLKFITEFIED